VLLSHASAATVHADSFADVFGRKTKPMGDALAASIGRSLPVISASAGFVYSYDKSTGVFTREMSILGQLFLEHADPLGRKRWNFSLSYQRVEIDSFWDKDVNELRDTGPPIIEPGTSALFTIPLFDVDLDTHQFTAATTFGVTDDIDLNLTVPVLYSEFRVRARFRSPDFAAPCEDRPCTTSRTELGVGDLFLRGKYRFLRRNWAHIAAGLILRIPTGSEDNFQGTGTAELAPMLYASTKRFTAGRWIVLQASVNGGINFNADDVDRSEARWGIGIDCAAADYFTAAIAVLGRHAFGRDIPPGSFDVDRCLERDDLTCVRRSRAALFGIENERPDYYDLSVGGRINLWRDSVMAFGSAIVPLNTDGFRADVIPLVGLEATF
jgi:hypothetical protein